MKQLWNWRNSRKRNKQNFEKNKKKTLIFHSLWGMWLWGMLTSRPERVHIVGFSPWSDITPVSRSLPWWVGREHAGELAWPARTFSFDSFFGDRDTLLVFRCLLFLPLLSGRHMTWACDACWPLLLVPISDLAWESPYHLWLEAAILYDSAYHSRTYLSLSFIFWRCCLISGAPCGFRSSALVGREVLSLRPIRIWAGDKPIPFKGVFL